MLFNTDHFFLKLEGVQLRAFKLSMHLAITLSLAIHVALLSYALSSRQVEKKTPWGSIEVHLGAADRYQSDIGRTETPLIHADRDIAPSDSGRFHPSAFPANPKDISNRQAQPAVNAEAETNAAQTNYNKPMAGMAIPQDLPIPSPGRRPLWSFQGPALANVQAAYQMQVQQQTVTNLQNQSRMARGQYEAYLKRALTTLQLKSPCRVTISTEAKPRVYCESDQDAGQVQEVIKRLGRIPAIPGDNPPLEIGITPASDKPLNILS